MVDALCSIPTVSCHFTLINIFALFGTIVKLVTFGTLARNSRPSVVQAGSTLTVVREDSTAVFMTDDFACHLVNICRWTSRTQAIVLSSSNVGTCLRSFGFRLQPTCPSSTGTATGLFVHLPVSKFDARAGGRINGNCHTRSLADIYASSLSRVGLVSFGFVAHTLVHSHHVLALSVQTRIFVLALVHILACRLVGVGLEADFAGADEPAHGILAETVRTRSSYLVALVHVCARFCIFGRLVTFRTIALEGTIGIHADSRLTYGRIQSTFVQIDTNFTIARESRFALTTEATNGVHTLGVYVAVGHTESTLVLVFTFEPRSNVTWFALALE